MTTRRSQLATLGLALAGAPLAATAATAATSRPAHAAPEAQTISLVATRKQITLPATPPLGASYIATFDLKDSSGKAAGTGWSSSFVVDVNLKGVPPTLVVLSTVVLRLTDGSEIHYERLIDRLATEPKSTGAVLGGTGKYANARGSVDIDWPNKDTINIKVNLVD